MSVFLKFTSNCECINLPSANNAGLVSAGTSFATNEEVEAYTNAAKTNRYAEYDSRKLLWLPNEEEFSTTLPLQNIKLPTALRNVQFCRQYFSKWFHFKQTPEILSIFVKNEVRGSVKLQVVARIDRITDNENVSGSSKLRMIHESRVYGDRNIVTQAAFESDLPDKLLRQLSADDPCLPVKVSYISAYFVQVRYVGTEYIFRLAFRADDPEDTSFKLNIECEDTHMDIATFSKFVNVFADYYTFQNESQSDFNLLMVGDAFARFQQTEQCKRADVDVLFAVKYMNVVHPPIQSIDTGHRVSDDCIQIMGPRYCQTTEDVENEIHRDIVQYLGLRVLHQQYPKVKNLLVEHCARLICRIPWVSTVVLTKNTQSV